MFTSQQKNPPVQCRLDFWLIASFLSSYVIDDKIKPSIKTDHSMISLHIQGNNFEKRGPGFWKFNAALLKDTDYVQKVKDIINAYRLDHSDTEDNGSLWDTIKCEIRGMSIKYSKRKLFLQRKQENDLKDELTNLLSKETNSEEEQVRISQINKDLIEINDQQTKGVMIRSKARWTELGEKSSKYF